MKRLRNLNGNTTYIYKEISFISILHVTTHRQSIANPPMEDSYGRLHMNIDVREIKQVVNILHIYQSFEYIKTTLFTERDLYLEQGLHQSLHELEDILLKT